MKVLFSAVGKSDPMTIFDNENLDVFDGGILHIARLHKPKKVYLYMSKEICEFDALDNRYEAALHLLDDKIEVIKIKRPDLVDVHRFDAFYGEFEEIIETIINDNGVDTEILCNVSSGTPAMKSAFQVISAFSKYNITAVQVDDPTRGRFKRDVDLHNYPVADYWESNVDNVNERDDLYYSSNESFGFQVQREIIIKSLKSYDYEAAYNIAYEYRHKLPMDHLKLLEFAKCRGELDFIDTRLIQKQLGMELLPYKADGKIEVFEYALWLKRKLDRDEIIDFLRGINPFMYNALNDLLIKYHHINLSNYCETNSHNVKQLTVAKLQQDSIGQNVLSILDSDFYNGYHDTFLSEKQMLIVFKALNSDSQLLNAIEKLNDLRENQRNRVSHDIVYMKSHNLDEDVTDYEKAMKIILKRLDYDVNQYWRSYDQMNDIIINKLK